MLELFSFSLKVDSLAQVRKIQSFIPYKIGVYVEKFWTTFMKSDGKIYERKGFLRNPAFHHLSLPLRKGGEAQ